MKRPTVHIYLKIKWDYRVKVYIYSYNEQFNNKEKNAGTAVFTQTFLVGNVSPVIVGEKNIFFCQLYREVCDVMQLKGQLCLFFALVFLYNKN